jgi:alkylhydroperoxidase family enzyme
VRTSALAGCRYCVHTHTVVALDAGLSRAEVAALRGPGSAAGAFEDPRERALVRWVDGVARVPNAVDDDERAAVRQHWADHEVVEQTVVVGATLLLNRFATALALPTSPDTLVRLAAEGLA